MKLRVFNQYQPPISRLLHFIFIVLISFIFAQCGDNPIDGSSSSSGDSVTKLEGNYTTTWEKDNFSCAVNSSLGGFCLLGSLILKFGVLELSFKSTKENSVVIAKTSGGEVTQKVPFDPVNSPSPDMIKFTFNSALLEFKRHPSSGVDTISNLPGSYNSGLVTINDSQKLSISTVNKNCKSGAETTLNVVTNNFYRFDNLICDSVPYGGYASVIDLSKKTKIIFYGQGKGKDSSGDAVPVYISYTLVKD